VEWVFYFALVVAVIGFVVAGRFLYAAWSDYRFRRQQRQDEDRRRRKLVVPMERRKRDRRS